MRGQKLVLLDGGPKDGGRPKRLTGANQITTTGHLRHIPPQRLKSGVSSECESRFRVYFSFYRVEACPRHELVRTPSATSEEPVVIDSSSLEPISPSHPITSKLYRWALDFLNREKVSADRKRQALSFLKQSRQQQLQCIRRLIEEIRRL
ncbi:hypothetical protein ACGC1H_001818 [Rhizoctonia solani]